MTILLEILQKEIHAILMRQALRTLVGTSDTCEELTNSTHKVVQRELSTLSKQTDRNEVHTLCK